MESLEIRLIIEILGKPKDHVLLTMKNLIAQLEKEKGVTLTQQTVHEPRLVKDSKELYTTFAEIEAQFESVNVFFGIIFAYMPSNIEIISPSSMKMTNEEVGTIGNTLIGRLHLYESVTKKLVSDRDILMNKLKSMGVSFQQNSPAQPAPQNVSEKIPGKKKAKKSKSKKS